MTDPKPAKERVDGCSHFLLADGQIRGVLLSATDVVRRMRVRHELGVLETLVLGHGCMGALLMAASLKGQDRLALQIGCSGPIRGMSIEANAAGHVRGYLKQVPIPLDQPLEDFNLSPFFGAGVLSVIRYLQGAKQPFEGRVALQYGNIAQDLAHYYVTSEQVPTAFHLSIQFDAQGRIRGAGGLLLQAMPDAEEPLVAQLEEKVRQLPSIGEQISQRQSIPSIMETHFAAFGHRMLDTRKVAFACGCNQARIGRLLKSLPIEELRDLAEKGPHPVEIICHYCGQHHRFSKAALEGFVQSRTPEK